MLAAFTQTDAVHGETEALKRRCRDRQSRRTTRERERADRGLAIGTRRQQQSSAAAASWERLRHARRNTRGNGLACFGGAKGERLARERWRRAAPELVSAAATSHVPTTGRPLAHGHPDRQLPRRAHRPQPGGRRRHPNRRASRSPPADHVCPEGFGVSVSTQIESGDLFDFDLEAEPILEVLAGKTLEIGMLEVLEENDLRDIRQQQELFEQARNAELAEVQRLETEAKRKYAEKQRRVDEEQKQLSAPAELEEKVAARACAKRYLSDLHTQVFDSLVETGHFYDPMLKDVEDVFLPKVLDNAAFLVQEMDLARRLVEAILADTIKRRATAGS